jgi:hypothetical protein
MFRTAYKKGKSELCPVKCYLLVEVPDAVLEVSTAVSIGIFVSWIVAPCSVEGLNS